MIHDEPTVTGMRHMRFKIDSREKEKIADYVEENPEFESLSNLEDESREIEVIAQEVYNTIPHAPAANSAKIAATGRSAQSLETQHVHTAIDLEGPSTVEELARHLGEDRENIKEAIRHLKSNFFPIIEIVDEDGKKHFLKQEERR